MSATFNLFNRWKLLKGFKSDNQAALTLGLPRQTVQNWKEGRNGEPEYIERMAQDLGEDPIRTILEAYAEQKTGKSAKILEKLAKRFGVVLLALGVTTATIPQKLEAVQSIHYAKWVSYLKYMNKLLMSLILGNKGNNWMITSTLTHPHAFKSVNR